VSAPPATRRRAEEAALRTLLETHLGQPARPAGRLATVDHKIVGRRYIVTAMVFFVLAGILALLMRLQLARPRAA
jgi:DMSO reductase anchor subunit